MQTLQRGITGATLEDYIIQKEEKKKGLYKELRIRVVFSQQQHWKLQTMEQCLHNS